GEGEAIAMMKTYDCRRAGATSALMHMARAAAERQPGRKTRREVRDPRACEGECGGDEQHAACDAPARGMGREARETLRTRRRGEHRGRRAEAEGRHGRSRFRAIELQAR